MLVYEAEANSKDAAAAANFSSAETSSTSNFAEEVLWDRRAVE